MGDVFLRDVVDLFGDPVPASRGKRGRPPHVPTKENRHFVQLALVCDRSEDEIAEALGINVRTLNRHYFHELRGKRSARMKMEMKNLAAIVDQVKDGKVAAMALLAKQLEKMRLTELSGRFAGHRPVENKAAPAEKLGKKAAAKEAAGTIRGKYAPPAAPRMTH